MIGLQMQIQEASISMKRLTEIMDYPAEYETADGVEQSEMSKVEGDIELSLIHICIMPHSSTVGMVA